MFIRAATNGQPVFNQRVQLFTLPDRALDDTASEIRTYLELASLAVTGFRPDDLPDGIQIAVSSDFVEDPENSLVIPAAAVIETAGITAMVTEHRQPTRILVSKPEPTVATMEYHFLLETTVHPNEVMDWRLNDTIVATLSTDSRGFDRSARLGRIDPGLPGWIEYPNVEFFSEFPLMERLSYFGPEPVRV